MIENDILSIKSAVDEYPVKNSQDDNVEFFDQKRFNLLLVDDEENILKSLRRLLVEGNYEIHTATSGEDAIKILEKEIIHLVISDQIMPKMSGSVLLKEIKNRWPETIRIMLTGHADINTVIGAINEGSVYKFITKPWNVEDLRLTINLALQHYFLIQENKKLKVITKEQEEKINNYSKLFDEYKGVLGMILVQTGTITNEQLDKALTEKGRLEIVGDTIVRLGFTTESEIVKAIQIQQIFEYIDLKETQISPHVTKLLPRKICEINRLIPIKLNNNILSIAMADPTDFKKTDNISKITGFKVVPMVAKSSDIVAHIEELYDETSSVKTIEEIEEELETEQIEELNIYIDENRSTENVKKLISESSIPKTVKIVNAIIIEALNCRASDIHIEPKSNHSIVRYRIDGMLHTKIKMPFHYHQATLSRIKTLSKINIAENRMPQEGRMTIKTGTRSVDARISTIPVVKGEKLVMRILDKGASIKTLSELGIQLDDKQKIDVIKNKPHGMVISTGPTGSGKTTLLYSILHNMIDPTKNFKTIEDPIEYYLEDANQVSIKESIGLTFAAVLKASLRQDPDVILVGEIRDSETADIAFKAAITGHMVFTTLHTNNTIASITRLINIGIKPYIIASALEGIISQRLVRKVCSYCKTTASPKKDILSLLNIPEDAFKEVAVGKGCSKCHKTGFLGRTGIFEIFQMDDKFRHHISNNYDESAIINLAKADGMRTLLEDGIEKVKLGITTLDELLRVIGPQINYVK